MSHASGPRWAVLVLVPPPGTIFSAEPKSLVPRSRLCNRAKRRRLDSRAMENRTSGANVGTGHLRARAAADSSRRVSLHLARRMDGHRQRPRSLFRSLRGTRYHPPPARSSSNRQQYPVLAVAHVPRSFAQQPRRSGYEYKDKDGVLHAASAWLLRQSALRAPSIIIVIVIIKLPQLLMPAQIQMPGDQLWPQLLPWIVR
ncbi:hypothetical protein TgHK011_006794 [Trichoderma gracile]|nr:hypothetical protein TgHK011_006794 [Trichoderma gracile]